MIVGRFYNKMIDIIVSVLVNETLYTAAQSITILLLTNVYLIVAVARK
jgi:hypothetical protein